MKYAGIEVTKVTTINQPVGWQSSSCSLDDPSPAVSRCTPDHRQGARTPPGLVSHPVTPRPLAPRSTRIRRIGPPLPQTACSKAGPGDDLFHEPEAHPKQSPPSPTPEVAVI